jgi:hypothetical protein
MILLLSVLVLFLACGVHTQVVNSSSYIVFQAVSFNGSNTNTSTGCNTLSPVLLQCLSVETSKLGDGDVGPLDHLTADNLEQFFAFNRHSTNSLGRTTFTLPSSVSSVVLYFFNSPQDKIGLPHIQVFGSIEEGSPFISYWFDNNNDLNQSDTHLRNVTLNLQRNANISLELAFTFPNNSQIDWLLLSEVILYNDTVGRNVPMDPITFTDGNMSTVLIEPQDLSSTITLSCTVVNSGSFEWQWFHNGTTIDNNSQIFIKDATRTSTLIINDFRYANLGNYTCSVTFVQSSSVSSMKIHSLGIRPVLSSTSQTTPSSSHSMSHITSSSASSFSPQTTPSSSSSLLTMSPSLSSSLQMTPSSSPMPSGDNIGTVIGVAVVAIVFIAILVLILVVIIIVVALCKRKLKPSESFQTPPAEPYYDDNINTSLDNKNDSECKVVYYAVIGDKHTESKPETIELANVNHHPQLTKLNNTNLNHVLVENPLYSESDENQSISVPPSYEEIRSDKPVIDDIYSVPQWEQQHHGDISRGDTLRTLQNAEALYDEAINRPFVFIQSPEYIEGAIYAVPDKSKSSLPKISSDNLIEICELGMGQFGSVVLAKTVRLTLKNSRLSFCNDEGVTPVKVAVKKLKDESYFEAFEKEIKFMSLLNHENVVCLLAVSNNECVEKFIVMEYMENGDLTEYLSNCIFTTEEIPSKSDHINCNILLSMCIQVANGMSYLASCNYIHRDLAARNCLVGKNNTIKIADFGLSRNLYDNAYYRVSGKAKMPIRWMSYECFYGKFSEKSDVWSYGITVWEIYSMGRDIPYAQFNDRDLIEDALKGELRTLLVKPTTCPQNVYDIIKRCCWEGNAEKRSRFIDIYNELVGIQ